MATKTQNPGADVLNFADLSEEDQQLVERAEGAAQQAHNPLLQRWAVGVAVRIKAEGIPYLSDALREIAGVRIRNERVIPILTGSNVEDPEQVALCECGEGVALATAQSLGVGDFCEAIAIVGKREGIEFQHIVLLPCDRCRGRIRGYAERSGVGPDFKILLGTAMLREEKVMVATLDDLPPFSARGIDLSTL